MSGVTGHLLCVCMTGCRLFFLLQYFFSKLYWVHVGINNLSFFQTTDDAQQVHHGGAVYPLQWCGLRKVAKSNAQAASKQFSCWPSSSGIARANKLIELFHF